MIKHIILSLNFFKNFYMFIKVLMHNLNIFQYKCLTLILSLKIEYNQCIQTCIFDVDVYFRNFWELGCGHDEKYYYI